MARLPRFMPRLRTTISAAFFGLALGAGGFAALAEAPKGGWAPDPTPHPSQKQWVFELTSTGGRVAIDRAKPVTFDKPAETPRVVGRYSIELWIGKELLDRVRFNVPLMGAEQPINNDKHRLPRPRFETVSTHFSVRMADSSRAAYLLFVDRESGATQKLFWPPEADGRLLPFQNTITEAKPGDFPDGGVRAAGLRDGGAAPEEAGAGDAGRD